MANAEKVDLSDAFARTGPLQSSEATIRIRVGNAEWNVSSPASEVQAGPSSSIPSSHPSGINNASDGASNAIPFASISGIRDSDKPLHAERIHVYTLPVHALEKKVARWLKGFLSTMFPFGGQGWFTCLKSGLVLGMVLGCLTMFVFHQFPSVPVQQTPVASTSTSMKEIVPVVSAPVQKMLTIPGFRVFGVSYGTYSSVSTAHAEMKKLSAHGITTVMLNLDGYQLVGNIAVDNSDVSKIVKEHSNVGATEKEVTLNARSIAILGASNQSVIDKTETFVSDTLSAVLATTAWSMDHGRVNDATTSIASAIQSYPATDTLAKTGVQEQFSVLESALQNMQKDVQHGKLSSASIDSLRALSYIVNLHGIDTAS